MSETITVNCPTCGKTVVWGEISPFRPFCSKRCQLIDLGEWAAEEKRIPSSGDLSESDDWSEEPKQWHLSDAARRPDKTRTASHQASCANVGCGVNALSDLQTLKLRYYRFIGWRKIIGIKTD